MGLAFPLNLNTIPLLVCGDHWSCGTAAVTNVGHSIGGGCSAIYMASASGAFVAPQLQWKSANNFKPFSCEFCLYRWYGTDIMSLWLLLYIWICTLRMATMWPWNMFMCWTTFHILEICLYVRTICDLNWRFELIIWFVTWIDDLICDLNLIWCFGDACAFALTHCTISLLMGRHIFCCIVVVLWGSPFATVASNSPRPVTPSTE